jgi:Transposase DDE domain
MSALLMLRDWRRQVQDDLLPDLHGHQSKALADLSFAMSNAQHCHGGKLAVAAPGDARPVSVERRFERFLANDRIDPDSVWPRLARSVLAGWAGGPIVLILDETPNHNDLRCMKITLADRKRALPIACACYAPGEQPEPMPELIIGLFRRAAARLPEGARVTLLADRGLAWPRIVDACTELGWHYVIRLQGQTKVRTADGRECSAAELAPKPGARRWGDAKLFKKAGGPPGSPPAGSGTRRGHGCWSATGPKARDRSAAMPRGSGPRSCSGTRNPPASTGSRAT